MTTTPDLSGLSTAELMRTEREIARRHIGKFPYLAVSWAFLNTATWLSLWPLVMLGIVPLWIGFIIATLNIMLSYLPSHEAQHDIIARSGERLRWLNELVGHMATIPMVLPYRVALATHLEHHKHTNNPDLDPDYEVTSPNAWAALRNSLRRRQPGHPDAYGTTLERIGRQDLMIDGVVYFLIYYFSLFGLAWSGYAIEATLLWWLPRHIALTYNQFYLSWAPHHPGQEQTRYRNTRSFRSIFGNIGSMGMQYHIVHHLHPRIPLYRTPRAYWELKPVLEARGAALEI